MNSCKRCGKKLNTGYPYCMDCMKPGEGPVMRIKNIGGADVEVDMTPAPQIERKRQTIE